MNTKKLYKNNHFLDDVKNQKKNYNFLKVTILKNISKVINRSIFNSKDILFLCANNSHIIDKVFCNNKFVHEINENFLIKDNSSKFVSTSSLYKEFEYTNLENIIITDIEFQLDPVNYLHFINKKINDTARITIVLKNRYYDYLKRIIRSFIFKKNIKTNNINSFNINNILEISNFEMIKKEKFLLIPINIPFISSFINFLISLPIVNIFCLYEIYVYKKKIIRNLKINETNCSIIIPCKNEEENIIPISKNIKNFCQKTEILFGDDNSSDKTSVKIHHLIQNNKKKDLSVIYYKGPSKGKSFNVYRGIRESKGDIICIYDADITVNFDDLENLFNIFVNSNADFLNCSRMIYPQNKNAMKKFNYFGNLFFAKLFSILLKMKITDTLCGTKIFYRKDWKKIEKYVSKWGIKDQWGDFDLLIGAYRSNLKIIEVPVKYYDRLRGVTKMTSVIKNGLRMLIIIITAYYKLRIKI